MKLKFAFALTAAFAAAVSFAQDEDVEEQASAPAAKTEAAKEDVKWFFTLPVCRTIQGEASVLKPGSQKWEAAEEGRFYALGSSFRAEKDGLITIAFGKGATVTVENGASFSTRSQSLAVPSRTIVPLSGEIFVKLPGTMKNGLFFVTTPGFTIKNMSGDSKVVYAAETDGVDATVRCVTGAIEIEGRHFAIPRMHAADEFRIRTSHDELETIVYGKSGDYIINLDRGIVARTAVQDDGSLKDVFSPETLEWHLSVGTRVQINRAIPAIGERMSVTMMTFNPAGEMRNNFAFAEGCGSVNTGELVRQSEDGEDNTKAVASATTDGEADVEDDDVTESESSDDSSSPDDDSSSDTSDDDSDDDDDDF